MPLTDRDLALGIDLGTTSVKAVLVNGASLRILWARSRETKADVDVGDASKSEQSVSVVFQVLDELLREAPEGMKRSVKYIGISGQMHGVVMWKSKPYDWSHDAFTLRDRALSNLITWQDGRCGGDFLASLPDTGPLDRLHSGFGLVSMLWLQSNRPDDLAAYTHSGTIQDLLVAVLTGRTEAPVMTDQNASGWGFYDRVSTDWRTGLLRSLGFPTALLPTIVTPEAGAARLQRPWNGIPPHCTVGPAFGDLETSVHSILHEGSRYSDRAAIVNISTSIQLTLVLPRDWEPDHADPAFPHVEYRPYFGGRYLAVGAGLNGGNCLAFLVRTLQRWINLLGLEITTDKIWEVLVREGGARTETDLVVEATPRGERRDPDRRASVSNIRPDNLSLGHLFRATCAGVVDALQALLPRSVLGLYGVERIYATGSALLRNPVLLGEIVRRYGGIAVETCDAGDAAYGAAATVRIVTPPPPANEAT